MMSLRLFLPVLVMCGIARAACAQLPSPAVRSVLERVARDIDARGYHPPRRRQEMIPALAGGRPAIEVPVGATFAEGLPRARDCSSADRQRFHPCVRFDALSAVAFDTVGGHAALRVIPQSFVGDSAGDVTEVGATPEVVADAEIIARGYGGAVVRSSVATPADPGTTDAPAQSPRMSSSIALGHAEVEAAKQGYQRGGEAPRLLRSYLALGPSAAVTGSEGLSPLFMPRECSVAQASTRSHCVRVEWLEVFFGPVPFTRDQLVGVIPHTYVGTNPGDMQEVEADSEVVAAAHAVAARSEGRVVHAIPWQTPVSTPSSH